MNFKKIILFNLVAWFCVSQSTDMFYSINDSVNDSVKNNSTQISNVAKIAAFWSGFFLVGKSIQFYFTSNETMWGCLRRKAKEFLHSDYPVMAAATVMTYAAYKLKDYPYQK